LGGVALEMALQFYDSFFRGYLELHDHPMISIFGGVFWGDD